MNHKYLPLFIFLFSGALYVANSGGVSIYILDEAKNAECAREMLERTDFITPTFNNVLRSDKPPLHYFFMMLGYSVFGVNPFAARFFSALFGALTVVISYLFTRKQASPPTAFLTTMVMLASIHLSIQFHLAVPDPYLVFFMTASIFSFFLFLQERKTSWLIALYASAGLATLTKGPVAIVLPGLIFLLYLFFSKQFNRETIRAFRPLAGTLLLLAIALPWYILVHLQTNGAWTEGFFLKHNLGRFTNEMEGHGGSFLITVLFVLAGLFPFSVFLPQAIGLSFKNRKDNFTLFNLVAGLTIVGFFMLSKTRLPNYTVPAMPFLAILTAQLINQKLKTPKAFHVGIWIIFAISVVLIPALQTALQIDPTLSVVHVIGWYFLPFPLLIAAALLFYYRGKTVLSIRLIMLGGLSVAIIFFGFAFPKIDQLSPVVQSAHLLEGKEVRYFRKFNSSYVFKLKKEIPALKQTEIAPFFAEFPDGVIISTQRKISQIQLPANAEVSFSAHDIFESSTTVLITRKKQ